MPLDCTEISVPGRLDALPGLLVWIDVATSELPATTRQRVRIVVEELFLNTVQYGHEDANLPVTLALKREGDRLTLAYQDAGEPFDPRSSVQRDHASLAIGGFGLELIRRLAVGVRYRREADANCTELDFSLIDKD